MQFCATLRSYFFSIFSETNFARIFHHIVVASLQDLPGCPTRSSTDSQPELAAP